MTEYEKKNLIDEYNYINKKVVRMTKFMNTDTFHRFDEAKKDVMTKTKKAMVQYEYWLTRRLELEGIEYDSKRAED